MLHYPLDEKLKQIRNGKTPPGIGIPKDLLLAYLKECSIADLELKLLPSGFYSKADLLAIINDQNLLKSLYHQTKKMLYFYFNPKREWKTTKTPLLEIFYMARRVGHILGLSEHIRFESQGKKFDVKTNGEYTSVSLKHLTEFLQMYNERFPSLIGDKITEAYKFDFNHLKLAHNAYLPLAEKDFYNRYKANNLVTISSGWYRHGVNIAFYGDYFVYCNRGEGGDQRFGAKIFKIKNTKLITPELIEKLVDSNIPNANRFDDILSTFVDLRNPVARFRCKAQKYGTCTFANAKAMIEPLIVLLAAGPFASIETLLAHYQQEYKRRKYKAFTNFIRNTEIDELIKNMFYAKDPDLIQFYVALTKQIITEHHGKDRGFIKDENEIIRACDFFHRLPSHIKQTLKKDLGFMLLMNEIKEKKQKLNRRTEFDWPQTLLIRKNGLAYKVNTKKGFIVAINNVPSPKMHFSYREAKKLIAVFA